MSDDKKPLAKQWFDEVWNKGRADAIDELMHPDCVVHGLQEGDAVLRGPEGFKLFHSQFMGAFPDLQVTMEEVVSNSTTEAMRFSVEATHAGDHLGMPATNKRVTFTGMGFARYKDGKIIEAWNVVDMFGLLKQIGAE